MGCFLNFSSALEKNILQSMQFYILLIRYSNCHSFDNHEHTIGLFLDFLKAFDMVDHDILLCHYGTRGKALDWFRSYLQNIKQYVNVNGCDSVIKELQCAWVPQGSLLGPHVVYFIY